MEIKHVKYVSDELNAIDNWIENNFNDSFDDMLEHVENKLDVLKKYAKEHGVPLQVDAYTIVNKYHSDPDDYEDSSSSSYYDDYYDQSYDEDGNSSDPDC